MSFETLWFSCRFETVKVMPLLEFLAGSISGALGIAVGHPLDTVKVRLQAQSVYKGIFHCVIKTYSHEGLHGFFKGMAFPVLTTGITNSVVFGCYSNALGYLTKSQRSRGKPASAAQVFTAGCFSGLVQVSVSAPIDLVKVRLQGQSTSTRYRGPVHCVAVIVREEGLRGLYRGGLALTLRDVPCYGLYFLPYEVTRKVLTQDGKEPGTFVILVAGGFAGVVTWSFATPMDVVKARLQMSGAGGREYGGVLHCMRVSVREEGVRVFFKGLLLNSLRAFPVNAVTFLSYESLMKIFYPPRASHSSQ
uniref:Solute carrier family 25 member 45 n=2 Tax=Maylandia zebra TaxID=106582 RepID=A0A3P9D2C5_9CICH|nr:solute carrier family 25 member 45 isoform X1 [Maylandia zebra]